MELMALHYRQYLPAALVPIVWCIFQAFSCLSLKPGEYAIGRILGPQVLFAFGMDEK